MKVEKTTNDVQLLAKLVALDPRLDLISNILSNSLDSFVGCMESYGVATSSFIKALVKYKEIVYKLFPNAANEPLLEYLTRSSEHVKMFLRYSNVSEWKQYEHVDIDSLRHDSYKYLSNRQEFLVLRHDNDESRGKAYFRIDDVTVVDDVRNICVEDVVYMVHKMENALAIAPNNVVPDSSPNTCLLMTSLDDLNFLVLDSLPGKVRTSSSSFSLTYSFPL